MCKRLLFLLAFLASWVVNGQSVPWLFKGSVKDVKGSVLPGATVSLIELKKYTTTNFDGQFVFSALPQGTYQVQVTHLGYQSSTQVVRSGNQSVVELTITLQEDARQLSEVRVTGKTETQQAKLQPIKAEVINTKAVQEQPATLVELMNRSAGIRIRQTGGLGSDAGLMMNGFQGRAIKNFKDGIPMDYLGAGYNISLVPVNMLERVEVYKGVLPTSLGADALGGAVNLITKKSLYRYAEGSYEIGSFNTHRLSLNALYTDTTRRFFVGVDAFLNRSDNNYPVTVNVTDQETATQRPATVRLFHNRFTNYYAEIYGGLTHLRWADELRIGVTGFDIDRQNQYGATMSQPFGASVSRQYSIIPTLRYRKTVGKLSIDQFLTTNTIRVTQTDTARGTYDWYGNFIPSPSRQGEISVRGTLSTLDFSYHTSRTNLAYTFNDQHRLEFNLVSSNMTRVGRDPLGVTFRESGRDILTVKANYNKAVAALGLASTLLKERLANQLIVKFYHYDTHAIDADYYGTEQPRSASIQRWGIAEALKFSLAPSTFLRASAELATRLPEQDELFGDGNFNRSNFQLLPERSTNVNLGFRTEKTGRYTLEVNSFYRITHDMILRVPVDFLFSQNQNVTNVRGLGMESDLTVSLWKWLRANGNFTYQNFRLFDTGNRIAEGSRLRNTPYFFANLGLTGTCSHVLSSRDKLHLYYYYLFVREYYLDYVPKAQEPSGLLGLWGKARFDAPNIIPNQSLHTVGFTYNPVSPRFSVGVQVKNLLNTPVYDNFRIQNAGRSIHLKVNYILY
ncbi:TonB-dependent receptor [Siphonobacter sp. SORGH_AS_0500]|uniref:TonB-dependent receptor n=1 Tax=Siphonobacter sp. SORGH_AS_0500 TaxID=1864824 RepID=UPI00285535B2|nr:TonB-dependent receptor [Siphonobacter sp. SORGH_AS_0500]MDR6193218.1 outer membrane receptor protein involved in Fe transport [Siphonobacter sp. SORGH_AS_0500]